MAGTVTAPQANPGDIATVALQGIEAGLHEDVTDETSRQVQSELSFGVTALSTPDALTGLKHQGSSRLKLNWSDPIAIRARQECRAGPFESSRDWPERLTSVS
jgi:hypothetical protein